MITKAQQQDHYTVIPELLAKLREQAGLTQRKLGGAIHRPQSWVHNCETGNRRVDLGEFCLWCRACGIDPFDGLQLYLHRSQL